MSYINKKKFVKLKENINNLGLNGDEIIKFIEEEGYDEFLFDSNEIKIELDMNDLIIIAQDVHLVIIKNKDSYKLIIE